MQPTDMRGDERDDFVLAMRPILYRRLEMRAPSASKEPQGGRLLAAVNKAELATVRPCEFEKDPVRRPSTFTPDGPP